MRMLAIETATEACSVALFEDGRLLAHRNEILGRGHAERLVPMIAELPQRGRADEIRVSLGPGSFTGVRVGIAAARAFGVAWGVPVIGYPTLSLVRAMAQAERAEPVTIVMNGGHGEWFVASFDRSGLAVGEVASLTPDDAVDNAVGSFLAGNRARECAARAPTPIDALHLLPDARIVAALHPAELSNGVAPIYGRAPDAKPPSK